MKNIILNKLFIISVSFVFFQQILIGLSTYFIGLAGGSINSSPFHALSYIAIFFSLIFIAYLSGGASLFYRVKLSNNLWSRYYLTTFEEISKNHSKSTEYNKNITQTWLSSEALSTFDEVGFEFVEIIAIYFNVIFTTIALFAILGANIAGIIVFCMLFSVILLYLAKEKIRKIASKMQSDKVTALHFMSRIWDSMFYGDRELLLSSHSSTKKKVATYFKTKESYKLLEQIISCAPILISIPLLVGFSYYQVLFHELSIGVLVAILPRSLQLFQNIHAASMSTSQILLLKNKVEKLYSFHETIQGYDYLSCIDHTRLSITNLSDGSNISVKDIIDDHFLNDTCHGRILITGENGAGKSSLLKYLKSKHPDALFFGPSINISNNSITGSVGQKQLHQLELLSGIKNRIIFLDEWDGNLDTFNTNEIDNRLHALSNYNLIIEIRHKM